jgi:hypothetical protein
MRVPNRAIRALLACMALVAAHPHARAAGGHHSVDDAAIMDPGQCKVEAWAESSREDVESLFHLGPACRIGPVELGLNLDRVRFTEGAGETSGGPRVKWAGPLVGGLSIGLEGNATWKKGSPSYVGGTVVVPLTWQASETLAVHLNAGRDFLAGAPDLSRSGISAEWTPLAAWSFVAERFRENDANFWRLGARWNLTEEITLDLSRASRLQGGATGWWTLGLTWTFSR